MYVFRPSHSARSSKLYQETWESTYLVMAKKAFRFYAVRDLSDFRRMADAPASL